MLLFVLMMFGMFLFLGVTMAITPYISREEVLFGVFVPQDTLKHSEVSKMKRKYAIYTLGSSILFGAPVFTFLFSDKGTEELNVFLGIYITVAILLYILVSYLIYYFFYKKMKVVKEKIPHPLEREIEQTIVVSTDFRHKPLIVSNGLFIGISLLIVLVTVLIPVFLYNQIPDQVPIHWGLQEADAFTDKSLRVFMTMPLIQVGIMLLIVFSNYSLKVAKQKISPKKPKTSVEQNRAYRYAMSKYIVIIGICTILLFLMIQCFMVFAVHSSIYFFIIIVPFLIFTLGGTLYIAVKYGQGGERYTPREDQEILQRNEAIDDDRYWKLGLIYFNPNDPAIWVEKRFGIGVVMNLGRWQSWAITLGIIIITIIICVIPLFLV